MAAYNWEIYNGTWTDIDVNTLVFSGDPNNIGIAINVDDFNAGTHLGSDDPGEDQCGPSHIYNVKYVSDTEYIGTDSTTTETISNTTLTQTEATIRLKFTDSASFAIQSGVFFCFNSSSEQTYAPGILAYAVEVGVGSSSWTKINDAAYELGGNNENQRLVLSGRNSTTFCYYYIAISCSPQKYGSHTLFDFGVALTFS